MKTYKFYDTYSLLLKIDTLLDETDPIVISSITLSELENIITSDNKDIDIKHSAHRLLSLLTEYPEAYEMHIFNMNMLEPINKQGLAITDDTKILATAIDYDCSRHPDETIFVTNNLALFNSANLFFGTDSIEYINGVENDNCNGILNNGDAAKFYSN